MAIGMGIKYLSLKGFVKDQKIAKVERYAQVVKKLLAQIPEPEKPEEPQNEENQEAEA